MALTCSSLRAKMVNWSPNDWPESFPELRTIDNLLRCSICFEYFNVALVIPECCHNYCSLCIRKSLGFQAQCPTCSTLVHPPDLRNNRVLDELVKNFVKIRVKLLELIKNNTDMKATEKNNAGTQGKQEADQVKRAQMKRQKLTPSRSAKRQKINLSPVPCEDRVNTCTEVLVIDESPPASPAPEQQSDRSGPNREDNVTSLSECPVCGEMVNINKINSHLDFCLVRSEKKSALRSSKQSRSNVKTPPTNSKKSSENTSEDQSVSTKASTSGCRDFSGSNVFVKTFQKRRPLPKLVYELMSEKELKQQLKKWSLPNKGDRQTLMRRHKEFVVRYNAECDSTQPKSVAEIVEEIERTEKAMTKHATKASSTSTSTNLHFTRDSTEEEMDTARQQYLKEHQDEFARLIDDVKRRRGKNASSTKENKMKDKSDDTLLEQTSSTCVSQEHRDSPVPPQKGDEFDKEREHTEKDHSGDHELLPQLNQSEDGQGHGQENTGELHEAEASLVVPEPPLPTSLESFQDEELVSSPSLGFEGEDQECSELEEDEEFDLGSSSPVIKVGRNKEEDYDMEEFEF